MIGTVVTYPAGAVASTGSVTHVVETDDGRTAVVLDRTAFHPVDTAWPDQPADRGTLRRGGESIEVVDAVVGAWQEGTLLLGRDVPVRTGTDGWTFVVAHLIADDQVAVGDTVDVQVDASHRAALSAGHTGCHLASLSLDAALVDSWRKDVARDALGAPAFDALAIESSRILTDGSLDVYRIGKSLRRKGFDPAALEDTDALAQRMNDQLATWVAGGGAVRVETSGPALADRRTWICELPDGRVQIPCGGTHVDSLEDLASVSVALVTTSVEGAVMLEMATTVHRR